MINQLDFFTGWMPFLTPTQQYESTRLSVFTKMVYLNNKNLECHSAEHTKVKVRTFDIAPLRESSPHKRSGMACILKGFHSFTYTSTHSILNQNEPYFAFPAVAGTHLPTLEGMEG